MKQLKCQTKSVGMHSPIVIDSKSHLAEKFLTHLDLGLGFHLNLFNAEEIILLIDLSAMWLMNFVQ